MIELPIEFFLKGKNPSELTEDESLELERLTKTKGLRVYPIEKTPAIPYDKWLNREHLSLHECLLLAMRQNPDDDLLFLLDEPNEYDNKWHEAERWINSGNLAADEVPDFDLVEYENISPLCFFRLALSNDWILSQTIREFLGKHQSPVAVPVMQAEDSRPWLIADPIDPIAKYPWYTPARYFARQLVIADSTLLTKPEILPNKIVQSLTKVGINKRGGKLPFDPVTIKKALTNVTIG